MGLFSFFRKNQQQSSAGNSDFYSQADEEKPAARKRRQGTKREEPVDPMLPQKKRARRRLIGAIALVLAAVIGLPMILDSEPKPLSGDIAIQIPSRDTPAPAATGKTAAVAKAADDTADTLNANEEVVDTAPAKKPEQPEAPLALKPKAPEPEKNTHTSAAKTEEPAVKAAAQPSGKKTDEDAARARAILEGKPYAPVAAKAPGKVALQVAALASQDKVNELQKKLQGAGLKSYTQKVATASGERIRVRLGPFANEAEAEKARAKLVKIGLNGKLIPL